MNRNSTLALLIFTLAFSASAFAQSVGDYRSNVNTFGTWNVAAAWQVWDGDSWETATTPPSSADGVITIVSGDSIRATTAGISFDQVVVEGALALVPGAGTAFTLNDGAGDDITINNGGRFYINTNANLQGAGGTPTIVNTLGGLYTHRGGSVAGIDITNDGQTDFLIATMDNADFTNNEFVRWLGGTITLNNGALFTNNDSLVVLFTTNNFITSTTGGGAVVNAGTGVFHKATTTGNAGVNTPASFNNLGRITGFGTLSFLNTIGNTGSIAPGNNLTAVLTVNTTLISNRPTTLNMQIIGVGATAGADYDQLIPSTAGGLNLSQATLNLTVDRTNDDPAGTSYTLISYTAGTRTGTFTATNVPSNFAISYTANAVIATKTAMYPLPVKWGDFSVRAQGNSVQLNWTTLEETNAKHFVVEHATDGRNFTAVGTIAAKGLSTDRTDYSFVHTTPNTGGVNHYRLLQVDEDGKTDRSVVRWVQFSKGAAVWLKATPNPMRNNLQLNVQSEGLSVTLTDFNGKTVRTLRLQPGVHTIPVADLPAGVYNLVIFKNNQKVDVQQLVKQ